MGRYEDFWHITGAALDHALATLAITDPGLRARLMASYLELDAYADAHALLTRLKEAGRPTAILSNGSPSMLAAAVSAVIRRMVAVDSSSRLARLPNRSRKASWSSATQWK